MPADRPASPADLTVSDLGIGPLAGVSFRVPAGSVLALSGPSGSGKSRLLRAIADLEPHRGGAALDGVDQAAMPAHRWRRQVMLVPADSQWWADTVGEHFPDGAPDDLAALGFGPEAMDWQVARLSSGERARLALLRAIAHRPRALLLDEPTANLDAEATRRVEAWLGALARAHGWPVIWVAHDAAQIARVADAHLRIVGDRLEEAPCTSST